MLSSSSSQSFLKATECISISMASFFFFMAWSKLLQPGFLFRNLFLLQARQQIPNTAMMRLARAPHCDTRLMKVWYYTFTIVRARKISKVMPVIRYGLNRLTLLMRELGSYDCMKVQDFQVKVVRYVGKVTYWNKQNSRVSRLQVPGIRKNWQISTESPSQAACPALQSKPTGESTSKISLPPEVMLDNWVEFWQVVLPPGLHAQTRSRLTTDCGLWAGTFIKQVLVLTQVRFRQMEANSPSHSGLQLAVRFIVVRVYVILPVVRFCTDVSMEINSKFKQDGSLRVKLRAGPYTNPKAIFGI